ncbi:MAG TPA: hypothetical protein DCG57_07830 [Candidatus Riflebacteria bacterium]|nr:hypothetical protein [Candidatus Riflebacteria bacterium]
MKRGCLRLIALTVLLITGIPTVIVAIGLIISSLTDSSLAQQGAGLVMTVILFFTTLWFLLAFSGFKLAEIFLKCVVGATGVLLVSDFFLSLFELNPFGPALDFISWLFFCSLIWVGLLRWLDIEELPYARPAENLYSSNLPQSLSGIKWFDSAVLNGWYIVIFMVIIPLAGASLLADRYWQQPDWFLYKFILCWSVIALLAWLFIYWKESFERRTAQFHRAVSMTGGEAEHRRISTWPVPDEWAEPGKAIVIGIPTTLGKMATMVGIACFVVLMTMNRGGIPVWLRNDLIIGFVTALAIRSFMKSQYLIDIPGKTIHQEFTNPFYYRKRHIEFTEVAMVTTIGKLSEWPLLWHRYQLGYSVVIILNDGTVLNLPRIEARKGKYFLRQEEAAVQAQHLASFLGCKFEPGYFKREQSFYAWLADVKQTIADHAGSGTLEKVLWESKLSNVSLDAFGSGQVKVDLPTTREKLVLCILIIFFILSTHWLIKSEGSFIAANPRLIYLLLLDSTSVLLTLFAAWLWLIDEHYIFDLNLRVVLFRSRLLFWRRQETVCSFYEISGFEVWKRHSWFFLTIADKNNKTFVPSEQYFVRMKTKDDRYFQMSDAISLFDSIPITRAAALSKLVFTSSERSASLPVPETARSKISLRTPAIDLEAVPASPVVVEPPEEIKPRRKYRRKRWV